MRVHGWRSLLGATVLGALLAAPVAAIALSTGEPTPIGLPPGQPGEQPAEQPATSPAENTSTGGGIGSAPLPPLPQPQEPPEMPPADPSVGAATPQPDPSAPQAAPAATEPAAATPSDATPSAAGLLDDTNAGLGSNIWQGSSGAKLTTLVPQLPAPQTQPSLRDLQLRLLLTKAPGPNAGDGIDTLVPLRAERLHAMGFSAEAMLLSEANANAAPVDARGAFEKSLTDGDANAACGTLDQVSSSTPILDLYWRKALLYCQIVREQDTQASLGLDLLREARDKEPHTKDFIALAAALLGEGKVKKVKLASKPDPLLAAMMRQAGLKPKDVAAEPPRPSGLAAAAVAARDEKVPLPARIEAGELAFGGGLVSADELIGLYRQAKFSGDPMAMPDSPMMRAQLYQAADQAFDPARRAQFIQRALQNSRARGTYFAQGALYRPLADKITPAPNLAWFAPEAARLMFWSGNVDRGGFWLNLAQGTPQPDVARTVPGLQILAQMSGLTGNYDADPVATWQQAGGNPGMADRLRGINAGLGLPGGSAGAASGEAAAVGEAAQGGRRGETALLALLALGGRGLASADGATLAQSLGGLNAVGLQEEARRIGLEAAILAGL
jgi:hypothetical protein